MLALERLRAGVGLVVTGAVATVALQLGPRFFRLVDLAAQSFGLLVELRTDRVELVLGPLDRLDRRGALCRGGRRGFGRGGCGRRW